MNRKTLGALIALNVVLLAGLAAVVLSPKQAQAQGFGRANYLMIAGDITGREQQAAIYVIETNSGRMISLIFNGSNNTWEVIGSREVGRDLQSVR